MKNVLVLVEYKNESLKKVTQQILGFLSNLKQGDSFRLTALIPGNKVNKSIIEQTIKWGADDIYCLEAPGLQLYNPEIFTPLLTDIIRSKSPQLVLIGNSGVGKDLVPRLAQSFKSPMVSDVIDIAIEAGFINFVRPVYGGKVLEKVSAVFDSLIFATVRPNALNNFYASGSNAHIYHETPRINTNVSYLIKGIINRAAEEKSLSEAEIIVSGGKGLKNRENFKLLEELANVLGGVVGASRSAVDAGWKPYSAQIGQTGKSVKPKLYIACGISGAMQHLAGMSTSRVIVAINKDPNAPIFKISNYGIIGDLFEIVPLLTEEFKKMYRD
ncbi:MAG: electron transfer flavoprotein subunit alpha/FixB family protein [Bacillota bacterium]